jgi:YggT family protein
MATNLINAGVFLVSTFFGLYILAVVLRFLMQVSRVDFYNPFSQGLFKITDPVVRPLRRVIPGLYGVDFAVLTLALCLQIVALLLVILLRGFPLPDPISLLVWSITGILALVMRIYWFALIVMVIASWIAPYSNHPVIALVYQLTEPLCAPARRLVPPMGGMDFSIILVFVFITLIDTYLVIPPLMDNFCPIPTSIFAQHCPRYIIGL